MGDGSKGLKKDYILKSAEDFLKRLQTDRIDLCQSHTDDTETLLEETLSAYDILIRQGKVRAIGASNYGAERLTQALEISATHRLPAYVSLQPEYNLYDRAGFEESLEKLRLDRKLGVISYHSLASGFLTGKYRTKADLGKSVRGGGIGKYLDQRGLRISLPEQGFALARPSSRITDSRPNSKRVAKDCESHGGDARCARRSEQRAVLAIHSGD